MGTKKLPEKLDLTPGSYVGWPETKGLSTQCQVTTADVLHDDSLAMKPVGIATTTNHVNRTLTSCMLEYLIQSLHLKRTTWQSLLPSGNVISTKPTIFFAPATPSSYFAKNSGTRNFSHLPEFPEFLSANIGLKAETLPTPSYFNEYSLTNS